MKPLQLPLKVLFLLSIVWLAQACVSFSLPFKSRGHKPNPLAPLAVPRDHRIRPDDKLSISIWNNENLSVGSVFGIYNSNEVYGKWILVDQKGKVNLPKLGAVKLGGLTCAEAATTLRSRYGKEIVEPVVVVKVLNREVTVLGEVTDPGTYVLDKEHNTLLEVFGKAGGFTDYARKNKIKLIRKGSRFGGEYEINLDKLDARQVNQLQVLAGDVIVVPTGKGKRLEKKLPLLIPLASLFTGVAVLISVLPKNEE